MKIEHNYIKKYIKHIKQYNYEKEMPRTCSQRKLI